MYSGTTLHTKSGRIGATHQRIDRLARRNLRRLGVSDIDFPAAKDILHFEGKHGPDGIKRKSPGQDEPWHFIDPSNPSDRRLIVDVLDHQANLVAALVKQDMIRASFEAAWLAHAIVDGLTPAHHYPLEEKIEELWGHPKEGRDTLLSKIMVPSGNYRDLFNNNWEYWGAKGVFATHFLFEWGVVSSMSTHRFVDTVPDTEALARLDAEGYESLFDQAIHRVYDLDMYQEFWKRGWSSRLANHTRRTLIPIIIEQVTLAWYDAILRSKK